MISKLMIIDMPRERCLRLRVQIDRPIRTPRGLLSRLLSVDLFAVVEVEDHIIEARLILCGIGIRLGGRWMGGTPCASLRLFWVAGYIDLDVLMWTRGL